MLVLPAFVVAVLAVFWAIARTAWASHPRVSARRFVSTAGRIAVVAAIVGLCAVPGATAAPAVTVAVARATSVGSLSTQISSNNVYAGLIDDNPTANANFAKLALPPVRHH